MYKIRKPKKESFNIYCFTVNKLIVFASFNIKEKVFNLQYIHQMFCFHLTPVCKTQAHIINPKTAMPLITTWDISVVDHFSCLSNTFYSASDSTDIHNSTTLHFIQTPSLASKYSVYDFYFAQTSSVDAIYFCTADYTTSQPKISAFHCLISF
jgi:hypothetical protein